MATDPDALVWGADVGGTRTRVGVADRTGRMLAVATAGPGNPVTQGFAGSAGVVAATLGEALGLADPAGGRAIAYGVVGLAGASTVDPAEYAAALGSPGAVLVVADLVVAYAGGTAAPHGVVVLAGTGAGAMEIDGTAITRRSDAWGWLLGDDGSAQWIGREAVRRTLAAIGAGPTTTLATAVLAQLGVDRAAAEPATGVLTAVYAGAPRDLARLAPLVSDAADAGDPTATAVLDQAADLVAGHARDVLGGRTELPIVLAGALARRGGPLHDRLAARLRAEVGSTGSIGAARDGVAGACWLALTQIGVADPEVYARLAGDSLPVDHPSPPPVG